MGLCRHLQGKIHGAERLFWAYGSEVCHPDEWTGERGHARPPPIHSEFLSTFHQSDLGFDVAFPGSCHFLHSPPNDDCRQGKAVNPPRSTRIKFSLRITHEYCVCAQNMQKS